MTKYEITINGVESVHTASFIKSIAETAFPQAETVEVRACDE